MIALIIVAVALVASLVTVRFENVSPEDVTSDRKATISYVTHDPIYIDGNAGFTNESGVVWGSGTESDPYIIEGWDINAASANGILIQNANAYFIVRDCYVHDVGSLYQGMYLDNCANGTLTSNTCNLNDNNGIYLSESSNNTLRNNTCSSNQGYGISLHLSNDNTISNNTCWNNYDGIRLGSSSDNTLSNNNCSNNGYGIFLQWSNGNTLSNNNCSSNDGYGIWLSSSSYNKMTCNQIRNNNEYGVFISLFIFSGSNNNMIWNNTLIYNNGATDTYDVNHIQAYDNGLNNSWNSTDGYGNCWSDWTSPDSNMDGIVDDPYLLDGDAGAKDYYPLTTSPTEPIPKSGMMPFVVIVILTVIVLAVVLLAVALVARQTRRKQKTKP